MCARHLMIVVRPAGAFALRLAAGGGAAPRSDPGATWAGHVRLADEFAAGLAAARRLAALGVRGDTALRARFGPRGTPGRRHRQVRAGAELTAGRLQQRRPLGSGREPSGHGSCGSWCGGQTKRPPPGSETHGPTTSSHSPAYTEIAFRSLSSPPPPPNHYHVPLITELRRVSSSSPHFRSRTPTAATESQGYRVARRVELCTAARRNPPITSHYTYRHLKAKERSVNGALERKRSDSYSACLSE